MSYPGWPRSAEENLGSDTKFGNRVGGAEPEKEGSPTSNRLWLAVWIFQVNRWEKISRKAFEPCSHFDIVIKWLWTGKPP